jgi:hypothetical protein
MHYFSPLNTFMSKGNGPDPKTGAGNRSRKPEPETGAGNRSRIRIHTSD